MRAETFQPAGKEATGSCHEPGIAYQTAAVATDPIGPPTEKLMEEVLSRENLMSALKRVLANQGAAGVDGMSLDELPDYLRQEWPSIRAHLLSGT